MLLEEEQQKIKSDLELYLSYFSDKQSKISNHQFPEFRRFIDLEHRFIDEYGSEALNFISQMASVSNNTNCHIIQTNAC